MQKNKPKYVLIYEKLREMVFSGEFHDGKLPSYSRLTEMFGASLMTVNKAVKQLENDGIIVCNTGRSGTTIQLPGLRQINTTDNKNTWNNLTKFYQYRNVTLQYLITRKSEFPQGVLPAVIRKFEEAYPWIRVNIDYTDDLSPRDTPPHDVVQANQSALRSIHLKDYFLDLSSLKSAFREPEDLFPDPFLLTLSMNLPLMYCKDSDVPKGPRTWEQFSEVNAELAKNKKYTAVLFGFYSSLHFLTGEMKKGFHSPQKIEGLRKMIRILQEYYSWKMPWNNFDPSAVLKAIRQRSLSMYIAYMSQNIFPPPKGWSYYPVPNNAEHYLVETIRIGINRKSSLPREAWLFLRYLHSAETQKFLFKGYPCLPGNSELFHHDFRRDLPEVYRVILPLLQNAEEHYLAQDTRDKIYVLSYPLLENYFTKKISLEECVNSLKDHINTLLILDSVFTGITPGRNH